MKENSCPGAVLSAATRHCTPSNDAPDDATAISNSEDEPNSFDIFKNVRRDPPSTIQKNHLSSKIIGDATDRIRTRDKEKVNYHDMVRFAWFISPIKPKNISEALEDKFWINIMQEKLSQSTRNDVWT